MATLRNENLKTKPVRGRPRCDAPRHISSALLAAAQAGLQVKSHGELTSREIASVAGANQAMITYYFDGKEGLFSTLIENALKAVTAELANLERDLAQLEGSPTKALIVLLTHHYFTAAPLYRVLMGELRNKNSSISQRYIKRGSRTFLHLCRILRQLVALGFYRPDTNIRYAAFTITCLIETPISLSPIIGQMGFTLDELKGNPWVDYVSNLLDREFGAASG